MRFTTLDANDCLEWVLTREQSGRPTRVLRGTRMGTAQSLFRETADSLSFPTYFGFNWDALDECLNDLEWIPNRSELVVLVLEADQVLKDERRERKTFRAVVERSERHRRSKQGADPGLQAGAHYIFQAESARSFKWLGQAPDIKSDVTASAKNLESLLDG